MNPGEPEQHLQSTSAQYPPPPSADDVVQHDFAQSTAAAALQSQSHVLGLNQQQDISQHVAPPPNPRKRKPAVPGSRGVANLTPEQLSKKRANDREAQRAIRARTKGTIEAYQARIAELESQQPFQEMQRALAERDRALAECEELRRRLAAVAGIVGNQNIGQIGLSQLAALTAQQSPLPPLPEQTPQQQQHIDDGTPMPEDYEGSPSQPHLHPELRNVRHTDPSQGE
ncbi:hypothetical protein AMS68_004666 [Peltaster fructicola]|uniref:BZIP domain-containing protein n=1 Tax=Peltaster fructicola TaxID=286661 RepID=A0A6H0XX05_9PEZI|nr:hypothetical protein AMS68_004666 [Peltaster fructicola]